MKLFQYEPNAKGARLIATSAVAVGLLVALPISAQAAARAVPLGSAKSFVVLAGAGITNTGPTTLHGDIGSFGSSTSISGTSSMTITGTNHDGDAVTQHAKTDLVTAFNAAAGEGPTSPISGNLGGRKLKRGVYNSGSSIGLTGALTLDGAGNRNSVFVFQAGSSLTTHSSSRINLINGARSCNVFWQVGSSATLGTDSRFVGTILAQASITATTRARVVGRLLARTGAVTLDTNVITRPNACAASRVAGNQVDRVPAGGVSTGDGSTSGAGFNPQALFGGALVFAGLGSGAAVAFRRRRRLDA